MFFVVFRILMVVAVILAVAYFVRKQIRKVDLTEARREKVQDAVTNINETIKESKELPDVDKKKLGKARARIDELLKEGKKQS